MHSHTLYVHAHDNHPGAHTKAHDNHPGAHTKAHDNHPGAHTKAHDNHPGAHTKAWNGKQYTLNIVTKHCVLHVHVRVRVYFANSHLIVPRMNTELLDIAILIGLKRTARERRIVCHIEV